MSNKYRIHPHWLVTFLGWVLNLTTQSRLHGGGVTATPWNRARNGDIEDERELWRRTMKYLLVDDYDNMSMQ